MGIVGSKGDKNTPLLNLCKERKDLMKAARDGRYHLAKTHLVYFDSLLNFTKSLNQFVHEDLEMIPDDDEDSSTCDDLICSTSDDSDSDCSCDPSETGSGNGVEQGSTHHEQKPETYKKMDGHPTKEDLGVLEKKFMSAPVEIETVVIDPDQSSRFVQHNNFPDILGLYEMPPYNTQCMDQRDHEVESDELRDIRKREGIPDLEPDSDHHSSLVRKKKKKKKNGKESSSSLHSDHSSLVRKKKKKKTNSKESSSTPNSGAGAGDNNDNKRSETCAEESPEILPQVPDKEAYDSSSSSDSSGSGSSSDLRSIIKEMNCISEKAVSSNSEVSKLLEVNKVVHHPALGDQFKDFASRVLGTSTRSLAYVREENSGGSLSITLEKLYTWEKKLHAEVRVEEKLRVLYEKWYKTVKSLDQSGAEFSKIYEAEAAVKFHLSNIHVSLRAIESVSMRIHNIRDKELLCEVIKIINGLRQEWRVLGKCHHKQLRAVARNKSYVHIGENGSSSRTYKVEGKIRRYRESLRGYIDAQRGLVDILNEWLTRNIMEDEDEAPAIFRVCREWLREIMSVDQVKVLSAIEEMEVRFRELGLKQAEEEKQRMRTERLSKELERNEILRELVTQERDKLIRDINDTVSTSLQECLVPVFKALEDFCFAHFKAYQNIITTSV